MTPPDGDGLDGSPASFESRNARRSSCGTDLESALFDTPGGARFKTPAERFRGDVYDEWDEDQENRPLFPSCVKGSPLGSPELEPVSPLGPRNRHSFNGQLERLEKCFNSCREIRRMSVDSDAPFDRRSSFGLPSPHQ